MTNDISNNNMLAAINTRFDSIDSRLGSGTANPSKPAPALTGEPGVGNLPYNAPPRADPSIPRNSTEAYLAMLPPPVRALWDMPISAGRAEKAFALAKEGYIIDGRIILDHTNPAVAMSSRFAMGLTWTTPLGYPEIVSTFDGMKYNGVPYREATPPPNAIYTTLDFAIQFYRKDGEYGINWNLPPDIDPVTLKKKPQA